MTLANSPENLLSFLTACLIGAGAIQWFRRRFPEESMDLVVTAGLFAALGLWGVLKFVFTVLLHHA